jgi:hypothetical protein
MPARLKFLTAKRLPSQLQSTRRYRQRSPTNATTAINDQSSPIITNHHQSSPIITNHHQSSPIITNHSPIILINQCCQH